MDRLTAKDFEASQAEFDALVEATPQIDRYCSRTEWILPFHRAFHPERELCLYRSSQRFVVLAANHHFRLGRYLEPLENMWGFGCPLVGCEAAALLADILSQSDPHPFRTPVLLTGIPLTGEIPLQLVRELGAYYQLQIPDIVTRYVACLEGGIDAYLRRRSTSFRRNLRNAQRRATAAGIAFRRVGACSPLDLPRLYRRILEVEGLSWKSSTGNGVDRGGMKDFYEDMLSRLVRRGGLRVIFAEREGSDVGYVHGAVVGNHYRGLQFSFDARLSKLSLGNLLQHEMLDWLCQDGYCTYDLGSQAPYKRRWAERELSTATILMLPRRGEAGPRTDPNRPPPSPDRSGA